MAVNIEYHAAAVAAGSGNGVVAGLFVPLANLPGIVSTELIEPSKERKIVYSLTNKLFYGLNALTNKLGFSPTKELPSGIDVDVIEQTFTFQNQFMIDWGSKQVDVLPLPSTGTGKVTIENALASGVAFVAAEGAIAGAGVLIPNTLITASGGSIPADVNVADARSYIGALIHGLIVNLEPNDSVVTNTKGNPAGVTPNAAFLALTNVSDLTNKSFFSVAYTYTQRLTMNQVTQTFDVTS